MREYIERLIRCGVPAKTAVCICNTYVGKISALENFVSACEKHPRMAENVAKVQS